MNHIIFLVIKYIYTAAISAILLTYLLVPSVSLGASLVIALFVTLALYFIGDLNILPRFGNLTTVIFDFILAAVIIGLANLFMVETVTFSMTIVAAVVIAAAEWFFHHYIMREVVPAAVNEQGSFCPASDDTQKHTCNCDKGNRDDDM